MTKERNGKRRKQAPPKKTKAIAADKPTKHEITAQVESIDKHRLATENQASVITYKNAINVTYMYMGKLLHENKSQKLYRELGYDSFDEWADNPEVSIGRSLAYDLARAYSIFVVRLGYQMDEIQLGSSSLRVLNKLESKNKLETKEQAQEWIHKATVLSVSDLTSEVAQELGQKEKEDDLAKQVKRTKCDEAWAVLKLRLQDVKTASWLYTGTRMVTCPKCQKEQNQADIKNILLTGESFALEQVQCQTCKHDWLIFCVFE